LEENFRFFRLAGVGVGVGEKRRSAVEVIFGVGGHRALKVGDGGGEVFEFDFGYTAAIERIWRIGSSGDGFVIASAGAGEIAVVKVEESQFLVVAGRGIVENG